MLVHSSTTVRRCGTRAFSSSAAPTTSARAFSRSMVSRLARMAPANSPDGSTPCTRQSSRRSAGTPAARRCSCPRCAALIVSTPTCDCCSSSPGSCNRLDVTIGTETASCNSRCRSTRKPQLVVMAFAPSRSNSNRMCAKSVQQAACSQGLRAGDHLGRPGAAGDLVPHRNTEAARVADIARRTRKAGVQHQHAEKALARALGHRG